MENILNLAACAILNVLNPSMQQLQNRLDSWRSTLRIMFRNEDVSSRALLQGKRKTRMMQLFELFYRQ